METSIFETHGDYLDLDFDILGDQPYSTDGRFQLVFRHKISLWNELLASIVNIYMNVSHCVRIHTDLCLFEGA